MTALAGYWSFAGREPRAACERMLKAQRIYGPDGNSAAAAGEAALGRSLFRLLPEDRFDRGAQVGASGLVLAADARLNDREGLCEALCIAAAAARTLCDAALILRALERWGEDAIERLTGDFALICWDPARRRMLLARDPLGQRPLHFHRGRGFFAAASMAKGLHALPDVPYAPDLAETMRFVALLPERGAATLFEGIERVEPGHVVTVSAERVETRRYWRPDLSPLRLPRAEDYAEAVRETFDRAVAARLRRADGAVGATLSGGLDSSAVTATAARALAGERLTAFTAAPRPGYATPQARDWFGDEWSHAAATAALYDNVDHVRIASGGYSPVAGLDRNFLLHERPIPNPSNGDWIDAIYDAARGRGCRVMLTGTMGDLTFSRLGRGLLADLLGSGRFLRFVREATALRRSGARSGTIAAAALGPFLPQPLWGAIGRLRGRVRDLDRATLLARDTPERAEIERAAAEPGRGLAGVPGRDTPARWTELLTRVDFGGYNKGMLAGWGIDTRDPTADIRLVELCIRIPAEQFLSGGVDRALARRAFADRLPPQVVGERRKGLQAVDWHEGVEAAREPLREEVARIAATPAAARVLDVARMQRLADDLPTEGWHRPEVAQAYRRALLRGVAVGHFVRRVLGSNS